MVVIGRWAEQKAPMGGMMMQDDAMKAQMSRMIENCNKTRVSSPPGKPASARNVWPS